MLLKFANYLLGTNNDTTDEQLSNENQDTQESTSTTINETTSTEDKDLNNENNLTKEDLNEDDYMYTEQLINSSKLKENSNLELDDLIINDQLCDQLDDEDLDEDQWIYITPIKRKNEEKTKITEALGFESEEENCKKCLIVEDDKTKLQLQPFISEEKKEEFNFYDYFNNQPTNKEQNSPIKTQLFKGKAKKLINKNKSKKSNQMEESWVIHPPACFQLDNTFTIEEHPLENLYIENPAISVMTSCKSIGKENNTNSLNNSSLTKNLNRILIERNQENQKASVASRKSMRKRANSTRKTSKKQNNKKNQVAKQENKIVAIEETNEKRDQQEKQILAQYLMDSAVTVANPIASTSTNQPINHPHHHSHHLNNHPIANNANSTKVEPAKGSKSLRRNNKVALKRDNLQTKPFTLHRKLC